MTNFQAGVAVKSFWTHQFYLSSGHRYHNPQFTAAENKFWYGRDHSEIGLGHNFCVEVSWELADPALLPRPSNSFRHEVEALIKSRLDHRHLADKSALFDDAVSSLENVTRACFKILQSQMSLPIPAGVRVAEGPDRWAEFTGGEEVSLTQVYRLHCIHRHHNPQISDAENEALYGKCAKIHGHEYTLEVSVRGPVHPEAGLVLRRSLFDQWIDATLLKPFDKTFLNEKMGNTSGEIITLRFEERLRQSVPEHLKCSLRVRETRKNSFFLPGDLFPVS